MKLKGKAEKVEDYGIDGTHTIYILMQDGKPNWFKVPNDIAEKLPNFVNVELIKEYLEP